MHRSLLSSLPRRQKRSSPTTLLDLSTPTASSTMHSRAFFSNTNSRFHFSALQRHYSKTPFTLIPNRNIHRHNLPSNHSNPSTRHFSSFVDKLKQQAEEAAKTVAKEASKRAKETAEQATKQAQMAVSKTIEGTQTAAKNATNKAIETASQKASEAAQYATKATKETLKSTMDGAKQQISKTAAESATVQTISRSTRAISSGIEQTTKAASQGAETIAKSSQELKENVSSSAEAIKKSSNELKENLTSTSAKIVRWFWWWSLAAIFVYGVASTLPMAIIKYTVEQKKKSLQERTKAATGGDSEKEASPDAQSQP